MGKARRELRRTLLAHRRRFSFEYGRCGPSSSGRRGTRAGAKLCTVTRDPARPTKLTMALRVGARETEGLQFCLK